MNDEQKSFLVEHGPYTIEGVQCSVAGWSNPEATITPASGRTFHTSWETVQRVYDSGKVFSANDVRWSTNVWYGDGTLEPEVLTMRVPKAYR